MEMLDLRRTVRSQRSKCKTNLDIDLSTLNIFHEESDGTSFRCAKHAINNMLGKAVTTREHFDTMSEEIEDEYYCPVYGNNDFNLSINWFQKHSCEQVQRYVFVKGESIHNAIAKHPMRIVSIRPNCRSQKCLCV